MTTQAVARVSPAVAAAAAARRGVLRRLAGAGFAVAGLSTAAWANATATAGATASRSPAATTAATAVLPAPTGPVVLSVEGRVQRANAPGRAEFDMAMLAALPQHAFQTRTPWYDRPRQFSGPLLRTVLDAAGADGQRLLLVALNDYRVEMPVQDAQRFDVVVARLLDGQPMTLREKGPLFVVYPFDRDPALRNPLFYGRSAWQLRRIEVR